MARMYCMDEKGRYKKFHPRIFTEMGTRFLFCTKEMVIHVLTLLDDTWKQTMNKRIMFEIADSFLSDIDDRGEDAVDYMVDQSQVDGPDVKDKHYVWIVEDTEEEVIMHLCKKIKGIQMRPEDMSKVIKEQVGEMIDVDADDEEYIPKPNPNSKKSKAKAKPKAKPQDSMDIESEFVDIGEKGDANKKSKKKQLVPSIINAAKTSLTANKERIGSLLEAYGQDSMDSDASDNNTPFGGDRKSAAQKPVVNANAASSSSGAKRKRDEMELDDDDGGGDE